MFLASLYCPAYMRSHRINCTKNCTALDSITLWITVGEIIPSLPFVSNHDAVVGCSTSYTKLPCFTTILAHTPGFVAWFFLKPCGQVISVHTGVVLYTVTSVGSTGIVQ